MNNTSNSEATDDMTRMFIDIIEYLETREAAEMVIFKEESNASNNEEVKLQKCSNSKNIDRQKLKLACKNSTIEPVKKKEEWNCIDFSEFNDELLTTDINKNIITSNREIDFRNKLSIHSVVYDVECNNKQ